MPAFISADGLHWHQPAADLWGPRLWLSPCTRTQTHKGYAWVVKLGIQSHYCSPCGTAEMHITQTFSCVNIRQWISVHCKWALRLKIIFLCSQKFWRTKFQSSWKQKKTGHLFDPVLGSLIMPGHLSDLRSNGQTDLSGSKYKCFDTPWCEEYDSVKYFFL